MVWVVAVARYFRIWRRDVLMRMKGRTSYRNRRILEHGAPLSPLNPGSVNKGKKKLTHLLPIRTGLRDSVHHALINGSSCHETTAHWGNGV